MWPEYRWFTAALISAEINTWFLIARRLALKLKKDHNIVDIISACFYLTWIVIRMFIFPAVLCIFLYLAYERITETQSFLHPELLFLPLQFLLVGLNVKWSVDLFGPHIKRWMGKQQ